MLEIQNQKELMTRENGGDDYLALPNLSNPEVISFSEQVLRDTKGGIR